MKTVQRNKVIIYDDIMKKNYNFLFTKDSTFINSFKVISCIVN